MSLIDRVWNKAKRVPGKNPATHRQDPYGNIIFRKSYGKDTPMGWQKDHIKPRSKGGSDRMGNLQAMQSGKNRSLGNMTLKRSRHSQR